MPIYVFNNDDINDDASYDGCPYISGVEDSRLDDEVIFTDYEWMKTQDKGPIEAVFNYTEEYVESLNYHHFEHQTDNAVALDFEGYHEHERYFSDE